MIHGQKVSYYQGISKVHKDAAIQASDIETKNGTFLEYGDTDQEFFRILTEENKITIVHKRYVFKA